MSAGTLTLTNNSDLVSGVGTSFSTELTAGDFVVATVGGVTYTLPVKSVEGDTESPSSANIPDRHIKVLRGMQYHVPHRTR